MLRTVVLVSGRGSNMQALVRAAREEGFPAEIAAVVSNDPSSKGIAWAAEQGLPTAVVDHKLYGKDRQRFEEELHAKITSFDAQLVCLAGFMRLLTPWFVEQWRDRLVNIHPSLLPAFPGLHVHEKALAYGVKFSGCTVHYVRAEMDHGPIIAQAAVPVMADDDPDSLAARILEMEHKIYPMALRWIAQGRVNVHEERCFVTQTAAPPSVLCPKDAG